MCTHTTVRLDCRDCWCPPGDADAIADQDRLARLGAAVEAKQKEGLALAWVRVLPKRRPVFYFDCKRGCTDTNDLCDHSQIES